MRAGSRRSIAAAITILLAVAALGIALARHYQALRDPFKAGAIKDPPFPSLTYGIQTFLWWDTGAAGVHLDWVRLLSFSHVKQIFAWSDLEALPGHWDWTQADRILGEVERRGLAAGRSAGADTRLGARARSASGPRRAPIDLGAWSAYCAALAERYAGRVAAYQIWNEPNLSREWGGQKPDPARYVSLLAACSRSIRRADPGAILISAGLAPTGNYDDEALPDDIFLDHMYRNGFQAHVDVVGVHAPGYAAPEIGPDDEAALQRWFTVRRVEDLRKIMLSYGDEARQMAIMEFGYTTETINPEYRWFSVSEAEQAELILRAYEYALANWRPWIGLMTLIYLPDLSWQTDDEEFWWSIVAPDTGLPRQAFIDVANMRKVCDDFEIPARAPNSPAALGEVEAPICP